MKGRGTIICDCPSFDWQVTMFRFPRIFLIALLFLISFKLISGSNLNVEMDYGIFKYDDGSLLEVYYSYYTPDLTVHKLENGNYEIAGLVNVEITDTVSKNIVLQKAYKIPFESNDTSSFTKQQKLLGQLNVILKPSTYTLTITAKDYYDTLKYIVLEKNIKITGFNTDKPTSSSLQICSEIEKSTNTGSIFYKNGLEVIPNPSKLFGNNINNLFYYVEFYNLDKLAGTSYTITYQITQGEKILNNFSKEYTVKGNTKGEYGNLDISNLISGKYKLLVSIKDAQNFVNYETENLFWIYSSNSDTGISDLPDDYNSSEYPNMPEKLVNDEIDKIQYLMNDVYAGKLSNIRSLEGKRKFLYQFWKIFDVTPNTPENEFKKEYFERIKYANQNLKNDFIEGWKTDRGRVFALYGKPDDIERHYLEGTTRPYEIWYYDKIQSGVIFVFIDFSENYGDYRLVHSTVVGELYDSNWRSRLVIKTIK